MNKKYLLFSSIFHLLTVSFSPCVYAENSLTVNGESIASMESKESLIKCTLEMNSPNLNSVDSLVDKEIQKLSKDKIKSILLTKKELISGDPSQSEISKNTAVKALYQFSITTETKHVMPVIDALLNIPGVKILGMQSIPHVTSDSLQAAYARSFESAKLKAESISKISGLSLGNAIEINTIEEVPPSLIREQLQQNPQGIDTAPTELRIFTTVKFQVTPTVNNSK